MLRPERGVLTYQIGRVHTVVIVRLVSSEACVDCASFQVPTRHVIMRQVKVSSRVRLSLIGTRLCQRDLSHFCFETSNGKISEVLYPTTIRFVKDI